MKKLLIVTALLLIGSLGTVACGGGKPDIEALATEAAEATPSPALAIQAKGTKFNTKTLVVPAGAEVTLSFDNEDGGVLHNVAVYTGTDAKENLFRGELFQGKETRDYHFEAPAAGVYYFRCDAHPDMDGVLISK